MPYDAPAKPRPDATDLIPATSQTKALLRKLVYSPSQDGRAADFLHDNAARCSTCSGWFCHADMAEEPHPWAEPTGECHWCRSGLERWAA